MCSGCRIVTGASAAVDAGADTLPSTPSRTLIRASRVLSEDEATEVELL